MKPRLRDRFFSGIGRLAEIRDAFTYARWKRFASSKKKERVIELKKQIAAAKSPSELEMHVQSLFVLRKDGKIPVTVFRELYLSLFDNPVYRKEFFTPEVLSRIWVEIG